MTAPAWYTAMGDTPPPRAATEPIAFHSQTAAFFGTGLGNQPAHATLLRESKGIHALGNRAISARVSSLNPLVKVSRPDVAGTMTDEVLDDHPLKMLLDRPHPDISRSQLLRLTSQYVVDVGEAYWLKVGSRLGIPVELHPIPPGRVTPILVRGVVEAYRVLDGDGGAVTLPADVVVRFYFPDPEDPWASEGYLGPMGTTADSAKFSGQHLRSHYQHDATPKTVLEATMDAIPFADAAERDRFYAEWSKSYHQRTGDQLSGPGILPSGFKLIEMAFQSGADVTPLLEYWRDELLMNTGTPRSILGQVVSGDRSSAETNAFVFDLHTVTPVAALISDSVTLQLAPDFDPSIFVEFDKFVSVDKAFELERENADILHKRASPNIQLEARGDDPVEWGERPPAKLGETWYEPDVEPAPLPFDDPNAFEADEEPPEDAPEEADEDRSAGTRAAYFGARASWERQIAQEKKFVPALARSFRDIFAQQSQSIENNLVDLLAERSRVDGFDAGLVFRPEDWLRLFAFKIEPMRAEAYRESIQLTLAGFGIDEFVFTGAQIRVLEQFGAALVANVNKTTKIRISRTLSEAVEAGESIDQMVNRIRAVMLGKAGRARARTIARTEVLKTAQAAQIEGFSLSKAVARKRWNTSLDAKVRDTHALTNGQVVKLGESFRLGDGELASAPGLDSQGGGTLSAHNAINCRCFVTPVLGD